MPDATAVASLGVGALVVLEDELDEEDEEDGADELDVEEVGAAAFSGLPPHPVRLTAARMAAAAVVRDPFNMCMTRKVHARGRPEVKAVQVGLNGLLLLLGHRAGTRNAIVNYGARRQLGALCAGCRRSALSRCFTKMAELFGCGGGCRSGPKRCYADECV